MADTIKKVYLKKKIDDTLTVVYPKTSADNVEYNDTTVKDTLDTINKAMTGATSITNGTSGLVPTPSSGDQDKFLKGDGTWSEINTTSTVELYSDNSGSTGTITLSENISSFSEIEIIYGINSLITSSKSHVVSSACAIAMSLTHTASSYINFYNGKCSITGTRLTRGDTASEKLLVINWATSSTLNFTTTDGATLLIYRVLGYK